MPVNSLVKQTDSAVQPEWIDKHEAAKRLNLSPSRVIGLAAEGKIKTKPGRNKQGQPVNLLHAGDVERFAFERENIPVVPANLGLGVQTNQTLSRLPIMRAQDSRGVLGSQHVTEHYRIVEFTRPTEDNPHFKFLIEGPEESGYFVAVSEACGIDLVRRLERAFQAGLKNDMKARRPDWMSAKEAAEYSGLPVSTMKVLIGTGKIPAIDCGPRPGGRWRVKRSDLDAL
jgi:excisionase family DNA binding protein